MPLHYNISSPGSHAPSAPVPAPDVIDGSNSTLDELDALLDALDSLPDCPPIVCSSPPPARPRTWLDDWKDQKRAERADKIATAPIVEHGPFPESYQPLDEIRLDNRLVGENHTPRSPLSTPYPNAPVTRPSTPSSTSSSSPRQVPVSRSTSIGAAASLSPPPETRPSWRAADEIDKFAGSIHVAGRRGGMALSLDFNIGREGTLWNHAEPVRLLSGYIGREMRKVFGRVLPFSFGFEIAPGEGKLHLHGAVVLDDDTPAHRRRVARVLRQAAGNMPKASRARQCALKPMDAPSGWAGYTTKSINRTRKLLGTDKITFVSQDLLRLTKEAWRD